MRSRGTGSGRQLEYVVVDRMMFTGQQGPSIDALNVEEDGFARTEVAQKVESLVLPAARSLIGRHMIFVHERSLFIDTLL